MRRRNNKRTLGLQRASYSSSRFVTRFCRFELLEPRLALSVDASPFAPITWSTQANGLPSLTSFPNAPAMIYLDYDGDASQNISESDLDNTPGVYSLFEQQRIVEHWRGLSALYSMFNVGVTTVQPDTAVVPTEWIAITNDMLNKGGVNGVGTFPDVAPSGVSGSDWWAEGYAHEISHGFGNWHQSSYDLLGNKTAEYGPPPIDDPLHGPIMGAGGGVVAKWAYGHSSLDGKTIQADVDTIAGSINAIDGAGDGYRPDDQLGTSTATASALTAVDSTTQAKIGIIERLTDQDWYSFTSTGGTYNILVGRDNPSPVDVKISIYDSTGMLIATEDGDPLSAVTAGSENYRTMANDSHLTMSLVSGTYYIKVESHGNYDDLGQYIVRVDRMMDGWQSKDIGQVESPGFTDFDPATNTFSVGGSGRGFSGTPDDGGDSAQFAYTKLIGDGEIIARVASMETVASLIRAGIGMRESLATGSKNFSVFATPTKGIYQVWRTSTDGDTNTQSTSKFTFSPTWLRIQRMGDLFNAYYGSDGVNWTQIGSTQTVLMDADVYVGLVSTSGNNDDRLSANFVSTTTFTGVQIVGQTDAAQPLNSLPAPTNVSVSSITSTGMTVSWTAPSVALPGDYVHDGVVNAADFVSWRRNDGTQAGYTNWRTNFAKTQSIVTGFSIERSSDNLKFDPVGTTAANVLTFTDSNLDGNQKYYYRVRTSDAFGNSVPSGIVGGTTRAAAVTGLKIYSYSTSQLVIEWLDASGESDYTLQRSTNGTTWTTIGSSTISKNTAMYIDTGRFSGTKYFYRVTTIDASGNSVTSEVVSAYTRLSSSSTPIINVSSRTASSITLSWNVNVSLTHYAVLRGRYNGINEWDLLDSNITTTSFTDTDLSPLTEYHYRVVGYNANGAATQTAEILAASGATAPVPSPWLSQDIGTVGGVGDAGYSNGTFTMIGGGADIFGTSDAFHYVYTPMSGDGFIVARVADMKDPAANYYSRAGIMIRESTAVGSKQVSLMLHTTDAGVRLQSRSTTNGSTSEILGPTTTRAPYWLLLSRSGTTITGKISTNGTTWTTVGSINVAMNTSVLIGMALTPRDNSYFHWASFDHVASTVTGTDAPVLEPEQGAALTSTESLPSLPESIFESGAVGAYGASSFLQTLAATACECCAFDCGITPLDSALPVRSNDDSSLRADLSEPDAESLVRELAMDDRFAQSELVNVPNLALASSTAVANFPTRVVTFHTAFLSPWEFRQEHRRVLDHAFAGLDSGRPFVKSRREVLDSITQLLGQVRNDYEENPSWKEEFPSEVTSDGVQTVWTGLAETSVGRSRQR